MTAEEFKTDTLPEYDEDIKELLKGAKVRWKIDYDSFDDESLPNLEEDGLIPLMRALRMLAEEDDVLKFMCEHLRSVRIENVKSERKRLVELAGGILTMRGEFAKSSRGCPDEYDIQKAIEDKIA